MKPDPALPVRRERFEQFLRATQFALECDKQGWRWAMYHEDDMYVVETQ